MLQSFKVRRKLFSFLSLFSFVFNIFQPAFIALTLAPIAYAEDTVAPDSSPTPSLEPTQSPSDSPSPEPTLSPEPTPSVEPSVEPSPSPDLILSSPEPSLEPSPIATDIPTPTPSSVSDNTPVPSDSSPAPPSEVVATSAPTPSATVSSPSPLPIPSTTPQLDEQLSITILDQTAATSLDQFDLSVSESGSATLATDKADYAPTDTAIITGTGFLANTTYSLTISSADNPATSTSIDVTTDADGLLFYAYQLDGIYRPNYKVEAYLSSTLIASTTFTDSYVVGNYLCDNDAQGVNDEPGQKDLTKMCYDTSSSNPLNVNWNWDEQSPGGNLGGNTGDACSLFDTDNDGYANYSMCVIIDGNPSTYQNKALYSCSDAKADRCTNPTLIPAASVLSTCNANTQNTDPFVGGTNYPTDSVASCSINLSDVGGASSAKLVDVCSYPSQEPNSDPSDCIFAAAQSGKLEVIKSLSPTNDPGLFNLSIDSVVVASNVTHNGTTGEQVVDAGNHVVGESAGTNTSLTNYSSSVACRDLNGTGTVIASNASSGSVTVNVADGSDVVCTITNTRINNATLTIVKDAQPNDAQDFAFTVTGSGLSNFSLDDDSDVTLSNTKVFSNLAAGIYAVAETPLTGWDLTTATCSDGSLVSNINLSQGENVTCTFTNAKQPTLTVIKSVTNNNGGTLTQSNFPLFVNQTSVVNGVINTYDPGTYTISETQQAGYTQTSLTCDNSKVNPVVLNYGDNVTCTLVNDDIAPQLTVIKHVINDNGGNKVASDFTLTVNGSNVSNTSFPGSENPGTTVTLNAGAYSVDEVGLSGYAKSLSADCSGTIAIGDSKTCTVTNDDIAPTLTLVKTVINDNGGNLQVFQVPLFISGSPATSGVAYPVLANTLYTASETPQTGYLGSVWGGDCYSDGTITLNPGDTKTCTITNNDIAPTLTFIKQVTNNYGGTLDQFDFPLYVNGSLVTSGSSNVLSANTLYTLSEDQQYGYSGGTFSGDCSANGTIILNPGDNKTCYISNYDIQPQLTVTKVVVNDNGGTKQVSDFPLFVNTTSVLSGVQTGFNAGSYTVSETSLPGYTATITGDCASDGTITLAVGDVQTCTITNDDLPGTLIVNKVVVNDNGGNSTADDFSYQINGASAVAFEADGSNSQTVNSGYYTITEPSVSGYATSYNNCTRVFVPNGGSATCTITNDDQQAYITVVKQVINDNGGIAEPSDFNLTLEGNPVKSGVAVAVNPGTYTADESILSGYTFNGFSDDCDQNGDVTVSLGESKICTLTNDDQQAYITLVKVVNNDNGGTAYPDDFNLQLDNTLVSSGVAIAVNPGSYVASETLLPGYSFDGYSGDCDSNGNIVVALGESKTCTLTNSDDAPSLTLVKQVINDDGGTAVAGDWTLNAAGYDSNSPDIGTYVLSESNGPSGYSLTSLTCDNAQGQVRSVTLTLGEDVICTFVNDDIAPTLKLAKNVLTENGGDETPADWTLTASGSELGFSDTGDSSTFHPVKAGVSYTLSESVIAGYVPGPWSCDGGTLIGDVVTLSLDEDVTCQITNDDIAPTITLFKSVIGGPASANSFGLTVGDTPVSSGETLAVLANTAYSLNEEGLSGYSFTSLTGDAKCPTVLGGTVNLDEDEDITCTITNTRDLGTIVVHKLIDRDGDPSTTDDQFAGSNWTVDVDGVSDDTTDPSSQSTGDAGSATFANLKTGTYNALETQQPGYELIDAYCDNENGSPDGATIYSIDLGKNETVNCTFVNAPNGVLHGRKWSDNDGQGDFDETELLSGWTINLYQENGDGYELVDSMVTDSGTHFGWYWFEHLFPGDYKICETSQAGYAQTYPNINDGCYLVSLPSGTSSPSVNQEVLNFVAGPAYDFGNAPLTDIHGYKWNDVNGNGERDCELIDELFLTRRVIRGCNYSEELLGNWTIFLDDNGNETLDEGEQSTTTDNDPQSEHFGWYWFYDLFPGTYSICEVQPAGWMQTYPFGEEVVCHQITVPNNDQQTENSVVGPEYHFGNQAKPVLRIQKSNDAGGNKNPGDLVTYTLTLDLTGSNLSNVTVTDITPDGFVYVPGSWTSSKPGVAEPNYGSPGTWLIGDMAAGDVVTLTYQAKIDSNQDGGTYNDTAWGEGNSSNWGKVLALGHDSPYVDDIFVGTSVTLSFKTDRTGSVNIEKTGEVLGAATELPATGAANLWLILGLTSLITGLALIFGGKMTRRLLMLAVLGIFLTTFAVPVHAADPNNELSVRVEQPQSPTNQTDWKLGFSVLDRSLSTPTVTCYVKKPSAGSYVSFGASHVSVKPEGDNGYCQVNNSVISEQGTYSFYVTAVAGSLSEDSAVVTVTYDTEGPDRPTSYTKESAGYCHNKISFHTASDAGKTTSIQIFGSKNTSFNTDAGTRVGSVIIGSDQDGSFTHDLVGDDCNKTWYYVIRAYDSTGNYSAHLGDEVVTITTITPSPTVVSAIPVSNRGSVLGQGAEPTDAGTVLGEEATPSPSPASLEGTGLLSSLSTALTQSGSQTWWWIGGLILAILVLYAIFRRRRA